MCKPRLRELCITQAMEDGMGGRGAAGDAACGWEEDGDSTQRAVPDDAAHLGSSSTRKQAPLPRGVQILHVIKSDVDNLELRLGIVDGVFERQSPSSRHLSLKTQVLCVDPCAAVWLPVGGAWSMYGMRCADLCGLVAFARCAARSLYMMHCADLLCGLLILPGSALAQRDWLLPKDMDLK